MSDIDSTLIHVNGKVATISEIERELYITNNGNQMLREVFDCALDLSAQVDQLEIDLNNAESNQPCTDDIVYEARHAERQVVMKLEEYRDMASDATIPVTQVIEVLEEIRSMISDIEDRAYFC